uniref:Uncharacterized protein n=1 Tax=Arundo donax TaxID=35708 RepID=A0A0A9F7F6_ARUDO
MTKKGTNQNESSSNYALTMEKHWHYLFW